MDERSREGMSAVVVVAVGVVGRIQLREIEVRGVAEVVIVVGVQRWD